MKIAASPRTYPAGFEIEHLSPALASILVISPAGLYATVDFKGRGFRTGLVVADLRSVRVRFSM